MSTATGQSNPFSDASEYNSLSFIIARALDEVQTVSIVEVKAVNTGATTVDVQVLCNLITGANISVPHGVISARPYFRAQGGSSGIILDPVAGDIGLMVFASRDSSAVISAKGLANPGSQRRFSWSDGIYLGGLLNATPTQYLQFVASDGGVKIHTGGDITLDAPLTNVTGDQVVDGDSTVEGVSMLVGLVTAVAGLTATGPIIGTSAVFSGSVTASSFIGGGGGGGTVTSVGISTPGAGVVVGGGPIITAGTLTVDLSTTAYAALALAVTALQSISIATGTGLTGGPLTAAGTTVALSAGSIASLAHADAIQFNEAAGWNSSSGAVVIANTLPQDIILPYACTLQEVYIATQPDGVSGSCTVTLKTAAFPTVPTSDITGGTPPAISSGTSYSNSTLSGWTTSFAQGATIRAQLTANTTFTSVKITLRFK